MLSQVHDGKDRVFRYGSRSLTKPERKYGVTRKELLFSVLCKALPSLSVGPEIQDKDGPQFASLANEEVKWLDG